MAVTAHNLAVVLAGLGRANEAGALYQRALTIFQAALPTATPPTPPAEPT